MSAMGGSVRCGRPLRSFQPTATARLGGIVVSLRNEQPRVTQPASLAPELGPISPELALVDPELATRCTRAASRFATRRSTSRHPAPRSRVVSEQPARAERLQGSLERIPHLVPRSPPCLAGLARLLLSALVSLGVLLTLFVGRERDPFRRKPQTPVGWRGGFTAEGLYRPPAEPLRVLARHALHARDAGRRVATKAPVAASIHAARAAGPDLRLGRCAEGGCLRVPALSGRRAHLPSAC